jgi:hypothetical protein
VIALTLNRSIVAALLHNLKHIAIRQPTFARVAHCPFAALFPQKSHHSQQQDKLHEHMGKINTLELRSVLFKRAIYEAHHHLPLFLFLLTKKHCQTRSTHPNDAIEWCSHKTMQPIDIDSHTKESSLHKHHELEASAEVLFDYHRVLGQNDETFKVEVLSSRSGTFAFVPGSLFLKKNRGQRPDADVCGERRGVQQLCGRARERCYE